MNIIKLEIDHRLKKFKKDCKNAGAKCTNQRLEIFKDLIKNSEHPDAETVFQNVRKRMPKISLDTVYRTLWLLKDLGLITTLGPPRERTHFDADLSNHHHFICNLCGATSDIYSKELNEFKIPGHVKIIDEAEMLQVTIHGVCITCTKSRVKKNKGENI
jgi:Fur family transcriptional regulator, peroxide stress response regulator